MAATNNLMQINGGQGQLSSYNAANGAVGTYLPLSKSQIALSTDDTRIIVKKNVVITEIVAGAATGTIQAEVDGDAVPVFIDFAQNQASNSGRPKMNIIVPSGSVLRFKVVAVLPA